MLTSRQLEIVDFLRSYRRTHGGSPSVAELQEHFRFGSPATVSDHLSALERKGVIRREPGRARNIRLVEEESFPETVKIQVFGVIPAGYAEQVEESRGKSLALDASLVPGVSRDRLFGLEVRGDSMTGAGIFDGDIAVLEQGVTPRDGEIVAALIDGETTLKRYRLRANCPILQAENPAYPELVPADELLVQGVFRALIRVAPGGSHG